MDDTRDIVGASDLLSYTVQNGDSLGSIASKFNVSIDSIIWANNFTKNTVIHPSDVIKVPPVTGLAYVVLPGDTMAALALKYKVSVDKIAEQNKLTTAQELLIGQQLIIPGAVKIIPPKAVVITKKSTTKITAKTTPKQALRTYSVGYTGKGNSFVWGNCTYFVANHKNITWHGNANTWLRNAAAEGIPTGSTPAPGAIIVFQ